MGDSIMKVTIHFWEKNRKEMHNIEETCVIPEDNELSVHGDNRTERFDLGEIKQITTWE